MAELTKGHGAQANNAGTDETEFSLLRLVPQVLRAREFRLYTQGGGRLVDLWQNGGAAVLGHTPPAMLRELKNSASRGLYAPFPHPQERRFIKALEKLFPGRSFRLYFSAAPLKEACPNLIDWANPQSVLWRPFADPASPLALAQNAPSMIIPVIPGIQGWRDGLPQGLCVLALDSAPIPKLPPQDPFSPVLLALITRGIYDLIAAAPQRADPPFPRLKKVFSVGQWRRQGIYLYPSEAPGRDVWAALFRRFLEEGFLLPPDPGQPLILPGALSPGEEAKLAKLLKFT